MACSVSILMCTYSSLIPNELQLWDGFPHEVIFPLQPFLIQMENLKKNLEKVEQASEVSLHDSACVIYM